MSDVHMHFGSDTDTGQNSTNDSEQFGTIYEDLRSELSTEVDVELLPLQVPSRPNIEVLFLPTIEFDLLKLWLKRSTKGKNFDPMRFAFQVMTFTCRGIRMKGNDVTGEDGEPLTFTHPELISMMKARDASSAIRRMYGLDGHVIQTAQHVADAAGYGDLDIEEGNGELPLGSGF